MSLDSSGHLDVKGKEGMADEMYSSAGVQEYHALV